MPAYLSPRNEKVGNIEFRVGRSISSAVESCCAPLCQLQDTTAAHSQQRAASTSSRRLVRHFDPVESPSPPPPFDYRAKPRGCWRPSSPPGFLIVTQSSRINRSANILSHPGHRSPDRQPISLMLNPIMCPRAITLGSRVMQVTQHSSRQTVTAKLLGMPTERNDHQDSTMSGTSHRDTIRSVSLNRGHGGIRWQLQVPG